MGGQNNILPIFDRIFFKGKKNLLSADASQILLPQTQGYKIAVEAVHSCKQ